jgi:hypothetical protein
MKKNCPNENAAWRYKMGARFDTRSYYEYVREVYSDRRFCAIVLVKKTLHGVCVGLPNSTI